MTATILKIEISTNASAEIDEKLESVLEALNLKTGGDGIGGDAGESGSSQVVKLRTGIKTLKDEIDLITVQTGVLSSILMTRNALREKENSRLRKKKQLLRQNYGKHKNREKKSGDYDDDDDGVFS
jgi:hypothetical protein